MVCLLLWTKIDYASVQLDSTAVSLVIKNTWDKCCINLHLSTCQFLCISLSVSGEYWTRGWTVARQPGKQGISVWTVCIIGIKGILLWAFCVTKDTDSDWCSGFCLLVVIVYAYLAFWVAPVFLEAWKILPIEFAPSQPLSPLQTRLHAFLISSSLRACPPRKQEAAAGELGEDE